MHRVAAVLLVVLAAGVAAAQQPGSYTPVENPYQADLAFTSGKPIDLFVEIDGVRVDGIVVLPGGDPRAGEQVECQIQVLGVSVADKRATVNAVILLEDAEDKPLERVTLDPFRIKAGKPFDEKQKRVVNGDALLGASKVYVLVQVSF
jgi:hypothetical protein